MMPDLSPHVHAKDLIATRTSHSGDTVILVFRGSKEGEFRVALDPDGVGPTINLILEAAAHATAKRGKVPVSAVDVHETIVMESPSRPDWPAIGFSLRPKSPWLAFRLPKSKLIDLARSILERLAPEQLSERPAPQQTGKGH